MCGLTFSINKMRSNDLSLKFECSLNNIAHRGPDNSSILDFGLLTFGHVRLSIIDLAPRSNQPMTSGDSGLTIIFNGEIYNYKDLRSQLSDWNYETASDTEVILAAYHTFGVRCFDKLRGQFSLAIYDQKRNKLVIARDRMGEKPLFIHENEFGIFFSSEIRGLKPFFVEAPKIDQLAFDDYLHYQYSPEPTCIISGVEKMEAGSIREFDLDTLKCSKTQFHSWHNPTIDKNLVSINDIERDLESAIHASLEADVPIAIGLSAGLDSSAIAYYARTAGLKLSSFTIGYHGKPSYDEREEAASIAKHLGISNYAVEVEPNDFVKNFETYCNALSEPIADAAGYSHYLVPKTISDHGFKVMLTGIGGDEIFWGYEWTRLAILFNELVTFKTPNALVNFFNKNMNILRLIFRLSRTSKVPSSLRPYFRLLHTLLVNRTPAGQNMFMGISGAPEFTSMVSVGGGYYGPNMEGVQSNPFRHSENIPGKFQESAVIEMLTKLNRTWLISNSVALADTLPMSCSIEGRSPFLDKNLVSTMLSYNTQNRADRSGSKTVLRKIMSDKLPMDIIDRPKSGFVTPIAKWVDSLEKKFAEEVNTGHLYQQGLIKRDFLNLQSKDITLHTKYRVILLEKWFSNLIDCNG